MRYYLHVAAALIGTLLLSPSLVRAQQEQEVALRFDQPMTAMINARAWDQTQQQWNAAAPTERFFDAVHRFLLVRFPGCAEALHAKYREGQQVTSARLVLEFDKQEFMRVAGYSWRGYPYQGKPEPQWHAQVWALRRPWTDDPQIGPTWNAYLNGLGYWLAGGGLDPYYDRYPAPLGADLLSKEHPTAQVDVTAVLKEAAFGPTPEQRLLRLEESGFLVKKQELANREYGENGLATGIARIWIKQAALVITLGKGEAGTTAAALPPVRQVSQLAETLRREGPDGLPSTVLPANLPELARALREARRGDMPDWMWERVQEIRALPPHWGIENGYDWFSHMMEALDSGDLQRYADEIQRMLSVPPGWFAGHQHIEFILPLIEYDTVLPEVVRYHLRQGFLARWERPLDPNTVFAHGKVLGWGTLNHMANVRPKLLLGAEVTGDTELARMAQEGLAALYRQMIFADGYSQEHGDSYYRGITLGPLQTAAHYSVEPFMRLQAALAVEKLLLEDISIYHPGLHRRVSRISRRMSEPFQGTLLLHQDVPEAALHMLSRRGVMIETDAPGTPPETHGMRVYEMASSPPARIALVAPWGRDWESHNIEDKPLPFKTVADTYVMNRVKEPIHSVTYMGRNYALASEEVYTSATVPLFASWRRADREVKRLEDLGAMVIQGRVNEQPPGVPDYTCFGILQHDNKLIYAIKPAERKFLLGPDSVYESVKKEGLRSLKCQVSIFAYGPETEREVWVNEKKVEQFPARARESEVIAIREGVTYLGLIPLPATDLGRRDEVVIRQEHPLLAVESYLLQSDTPLAEAAVPALADARAGWVVEMGDAQEYPSFAAFRAHLRAARMTAKWREAERVWDLSYTSGKDTLEMGFRTTFEREVLWHQQLNPSLVFAHQRVNGAWPWPPRGISLDNPLAQMGKAARLEKGGAVLEKREGQMGLLRVEPVTGTYEGVNPFPDPMPFELRTPEGMVVRAEGLFGCGRVTVRPKEGRLWVDYALPPPTGAPGEAQLQARLPELYAPGQDVVATQRRAARALLVSGLPQAPTVVLNGSPALEPLARFESGGRVWWRVPIVSEMPVRP